MTAPDAKPGRVVGPRVLVQYAGQETDSWMWRCSVCGEGDWFDAAMRITYRSADMHARTCPALHLALCKERIAEVHSTLTEYRDESYRDGLATNSMWSVGASIAYGSAREILTTLTGIPAQPATEAS